MTVTIGRFIRRAIECYLIFYYIITVELISTNMYTLPRRFKAESKVHDTIKI